MLAFVFSSLGHTLMHMLTAMFFIIVLTLEQAWQMPYAQLLPLWTLGALAVGLFALPAGWLADRWSAPAMLAVMFVGMGSACLLCALADGTGALWLGLSLLGIFAAIYHPVGIPWLVRTSAGGRRGMLLGLNGVFGALGVAASGGVTALLIDAYGWRAAFAVPGLACLSIGLLMTGFLLSGRLRDDSEQLPTGVTYGSGREDATAEHRRVLAALLLAMFVLGFIYQSSQAVLPKVFAERIAGDGDIARTGLLITAVYTLAGVMQLLGGYLADRFALRTVYLLAATLQIPALMLVAALFGAPLLVAATAAVLLSTAAMPAENMLLAHYAPARRHGFFFGVKFVLSFGAAPLAVAFVAWVASAGDGLATVFFALAALAGIAVLAGLTVPAQPAAPHGANRPAPTPV
jgi:FSR family fosmidomycin resistance protein-like MFS transporter